MSAIKDSLAPEFERGKPWNPRKNVDDPNPLYARGVKWSTGPTAHGDADFLTLSDDDGTAWSIIVGTYKLRKILLEGEISKWDESRGEYVVERTIGPVEPGELIAIEYRGEREFTNRDGRRVTSPEYRVLRKPNDRNETGDSTDDAEPAAESPADDGIPF